MPVVSALILPHGTMPFDGDLSLNSDGDSMAAKRLQVLPEGLRRDCTAIFTSCQEAVKKVQATSPEVVVLNTPHGICLSESLGVYVNPTAKGTTEWNEQWDEYTVQIELDVQLSQNLIQHLKNDGIPVEGITSFSRYDAPLRWGETVPLWYLAPLINNQAPPTKVIIISNSLSLRTKSIEDLTKIGESMQAFLNGLKQHVLYVCSGDLSHAHSTDCTLPLYLANPRWTSIKPNDTALPFDKCIEKWVKATPTATDDQTMIPDKSCEPYGTVWTHDSIKQANHWLHQAHQIKDRALTCGYNGFCLLHGILEKELMKNVSDTAATAAHYGLQKQFSVDFFCRLAPTYYGMMAVSFVKKEVNRVN